MNPLKTSMSSREFNQRTSAAKTAADQGPVLITDRGDPSHVLLSYEDYRELTEAQPHLVDMLCATPGIGEVELEIPEFDEMAEPANLS